MSMQAPIRNRSCKARIYMVMLAVALASSELMAQGWRFKLESVGASGEYHVGLSKRVDVSSARGLGGGAELRFRIHDHLGLHLNLGYQRFDISEGDPITKWDWAYWNRNYRNYVVSLLGDSAYFEGRLETLRAIPNERLTAGKWTGKDSLYSVHLTPVVYMHAVPFTASLAYSVSLSDDLQLDAFLSSSLFFFEKNLYLNERWEKRRVPDAGPDSGKVYYFSYGYYNFAPPKKGTVLSVGGGVIGQWRISSLISVRVGAAYDSFTGTLRRSDEELLPFRNRLVLKASMAVHY